MYRHNLKNLTQIVIEWLKKIPVYSVYVTEGLTIVFFQKNIEIVIFDTSAKK